jgi:hypothetical protein
MEKLKAKEKVKAKAKARKGKNKKGASDDDEYKDSEEDEYTALSKGGFTRTGKGRVLPPVGSFENCAKCDKKFTVVWVSSAPRAAPALIMPFRHGTRWQPIQARGSFVTAVQRPLGLIRSRSPLRLGNARIRRRGGR